MQIDTGKFPTKAEAKSSMKDIREAVAAAQHALDQNDWAGVAECLAHWLAPSAGTFAYEIAEVTGQQL